MFSLNSTVEGLRVHNTRVINAAAALKNARIDRNKILYALKTGACATATAVKKYVKSVYGTKSTQYKTLTAISVPRNSKV